LATRPERMITYEDYLTFPDEPRLEIIEGEAYVVPAPNRRHQEVLGRLHLRIGHFVEQHGGGAVFFAPFDVVLTDTDIVQPDIVFIADEHLDVLTDANVWGTPSWVVEVLSPSNPSHDRKRKLAAYERTGVPEYWIVDPAKGSVDIYRLSNEGYGEPVRLTAPATARPVRPANFELDLTDLFRD